MKNKMWWKYWNRRAVVGEDIPAIVICGVVIVAWPRLWIGNRNAAVARFGSIYG